MKAKKLIVTKKNVDLNIVEITLLSLEEYLAAQNIIPARNDCWWLRSPYSSCDSAAYSVDDYGNVFYYSVEDSQVGVSPALRIRNLGSSNLNSGDKFELAEHAWTVISDDLALCDEIVGKTCFRNIRDEIEKTYFRKNWKAKDVNDYEKSDIKKWLENWAAENGIDFSVVFTTA